MIVNNTGYLSMEKILEMIDSINFAVYETTKDTFILVKGEFLPDSIELFRAKEDRLPWKLVRGKKIISGKKIFDTTRDRLGETEKWRNITQLMTYEGRAE
jgi:hypothetical protein